MKKDNRVILVQSTFCHRRKCTKSLRLLDRLGKQLTVTASGEHAHPMLAIAAVGACLETWHKTTHFCQTTAATASVTDH